MRHLTEVTALGPSLGFPDAEIAVHLQFNDGTSALVEGSDIHALADIALVASQLRRARERLDLLAHLEETDRDRDGELADPASWPSEATL
ncbi:MULTISPECIES: hypothetical protein [unclassified Mycobacterium]|uniref:hypothetical protein n=1 Tax=unclassified Mycobacterium TaxID=2642494 RepID=UPI000800F903|nr:MULTISPECIES: hypothetical protein [unclassified Mycobacterium]OBG75333.1 hypothetical protein A5700_01810 [Mycobacterium sp. E1214]OBH31606.1 hypothetical protein A5693_15930 [Mycobacterium sp. E1319]